MTTLLLKYSKNNNKNMTQVKTYILTRKENFMRDPNTIYDAYFKFVVNATSEEEARNIVQNFSNGDEMYKHDENGMTVNREEKLSVWDNQELTNCVLMDERRTGIVSAEFNAG